MTEFRATKVSSRKAQMRESSAEVLSPHCSEPFICFLNQLVYFSVSDLKNFKCYEHTMSYFLREKVPLT